jgi:hypothetical protein
MLRITIRTIAVQDRYTDRNVTYGYSRAKGKDLLIPDCHYAPYHLGEPGE